MPDHSYEEIRSATLDLLAGREKIYGYDLDQYGHLQINVASLLIERYGHSRNQGGRDPVLSANDKDKFLEIFWGLFREGAITLGIGDSSPNFPFFRVSEFGRRFLDGGQAYFFHDLSSYEREIKKQIPNINDLSLLYLKEAMQAFRSGCILSSTVMLGVATEHSFLLLLEVIAAHPVHSVTYTKVEKEKSILPKIMKFRDILELNIKVVPYDIRENLDSDFLGTINMIRNFRNDSGHPTGKIIDREQAYILLQLFIPYCRKIYKLIDYFS